MVAEPATLPKVRIPPQVHRQLAIEAAESKVSLNRLVSAKLAHG
jgi:predicted HicB family RNase H-like nuclease